MGVTKALLIGLVIIIGIAVLIPLILRFATLPSETSSGGGFGGGSKAGEGLLVSFNEGESWEDAAKTQNKKDRFPSKILGVAFHPKNHDLVFLGSKSNGLWKSADSGRSWQKVKDKVGVLKSQSDVYKVAISRSDPKIIYAAVFQDKRGRVLRSEDEGESFREIYFVNTDKFGVFDLYLNPGNANNILIATGQGGVLETQNGGKTWRIKKWFGYPLKRLLGSPTSPFEMYAVTDRGQFFKTFDGGEDWEDFTENIRRGWQAAYPAAEQRPGDIFSLSDQLRPVGSNLSRVLETAVLDPSVSTTLYLSLSNGLLRSYDGGVYWSRVDLPIPSKDSPSISSVAVSSRSSALILAGAGSQIYKSSDNGINWKIINLPTKKKVKDVFISPLRPSDVFAVLQ